MEESKKAKIEKIIKDYLKEKDACDAWLIENIHKLNNDITLHSNELKFDLDDVILPSKDNSVSNTKTNMVNSNPLRALDMFEQLKKEYRENEESTLQAKIEYLNYLFDLSKFYNSISFSLYRLSPKYKNAINIFMDTGNIRNITLETGLSYTSARNLLQGAIDMIINSLDSKLVNRILAKHIEV